MKRYYKNWYQHYLEIEAQKEQDIKRGYYSNLPSKNEERQHKKSTLSQDEQDQNPIVRTVEYTDKKQKKRSLLTIILPLTALVGFVFLWYQMDIGPTRQLVDEALVFVRFREPIVEVANHNRNFLTQHLEFAEAVTVYLNHNNELEFDRLESMFYDLQERYKDIASLSEVEDIEVVELFSTKMSEVEQLMRALESEANIEEAYAKFVRNQQEITTLLQEKLDNLD